MIAMSLPWFGVSEKDATAAAGLGVDSGLPTRNGWESLIFLDIGLLVAGLTAIAFGVVRLTAPGVAPLATSVATATLGTLAALVIGYRIIEPIEDAGLEYGIWLALIAAALIAGGACGAVRAQFRRGSAPTGGSRHEPSAGS